MISVYTLTSSLHDQQVLDESSRKFLSSIGFDYTMKGEDFSTYGQSDLDLIFVRTGGTEGLFKPLLPQIQRASRQPVYLLTSGMSNSLAASMEILSYLRSKGFPGEIIHGSPSFIASRIRTLEATEIARKRLASLRLGVIGAPSDWLIASKADYAAVRTKLGIELVDIPMTELLGEIATVPHDDQAARIAFGTELFSAAPKVQGAATGAYRIYDSLKRVMARHNLDGFTLRCFDLLTTVRNTGCFALAKINSQGFLAGCEGDVPALLSMAIGRAVTGVSGFQANPSSINPETGEVIFAHCTIPLDMVTRYTYDTHFESGIGVGIRGHLREGEVTVLKVSGDLSRCFVAEGTLLRNQSDPNLCRTQVVIHLDDTGYFLTDPIGNHHIILPGHVASSIKALLG